MLITNIIQYELKVKKYIRNVQTYICHFYVSNIWNFIYWNFYKNYIYLEISIVLYPFFHHEYDIGYVKLCLYCDMNEHWAFSNCNTLPNYHDDFTNITLRLPSNKKDTENKPVIRNVLIMGHVAFYVESCFILEYLFLDYI